MTSTNPEPDPSAITEIESDVSMKSFPYPPPSIAENASVDLLPQGADKSANDLSRVGAALVPGPKTFQNYISPIEKLTLMLVFTL